MTAYMQHSSFSLLVLAALLFYMGGSFTQQLAISAPKKLADKVVNTAQLAKKDKKTASSKTAAGASAQLVDPLALVKDPTAYLEKTITLKGEFRTFSSLGLDYDPAFKDSKDFVTLLIRRPDVTHHAIPLSELKLFYSREDTKKLVMLEPGDEIQLTGVVFSDALGDAWVEVSKLDILTVKPEKKDEADSSIGEASNLDE